LLLSVAELDDVITEVTTLVLEWVMYRVVQHAVVARSEMVEPGVNVVPPLDPDGV
jgi:hypothetical protein